MTIQPLLTGKKFSYKLRKCGMTKSLFNNKWIPAVDMWRDADEYVKKMLSNLPNRKLTDAERKTYVDLPNTEVRIMYLKSILK